jgi:hypothetical protein
VRGVGPVEEPACQRLLQPSCNRFIQGRMLEVRCWGRGSSALHQLRMRTSKAAGDRKRTPAKPRQGLAQAAVVRMRAARIAAVDNCWSNFECLFT